jgi:membrane-bound metal-dependent hydrolase YbcI (DUF457 family)
VPSPVGHTLGGLAAGWAAGGRPARAWIPQAVLFSLVAMSPDLDLLWGAHHRATHSLAAIAVAGTLAYGAGLRTGRTSLAIPVAAAYGSHILLDMLGADSTPPIGVTLFWPFSGEYVIAPVTPFPAISRRYWLPGFWEHNLGAMAFELVVLGPMAAAAWFIRRQAGRE